MAKKKIIAAGGLVENEHGDLLMIYRRDKWDLPKGKLDKGETIENCAIREVEEETGLHQIERGKLIGITYHEYFDKYLNKDVEKETHWYAMKAPGIQKLIPQTEEDITAICWVNKKDIKEKLNNSFPSIIDVITKHLGAY